MSPIDLLNLAEQADKEGRFAIADKLTQRATRVADNWFTSALKGLAGSGERSFLEGLEKLGLQKEMFGQGKFPTRFLERIDPHTPDGLKELTGIRPGLPQMTATEIPFVRSTAELEQILTNLTYKIKNLNSTDEEVIKGIKEFIKDGKIANPDVRKKVFDEAIKQGLVLRNSKGRPEDILAILNKEALKPDAVRQGLKPWINANAKAIGGLTAAGIGYNLYNTTKQQNSQQPGSNYSDPGAAGSPFAGDGVYQGGGESTNSGGGGGGYQGPTYSMPSANQSFQPMRGYQPANRLEKEFYLPRTNDQAEPLYPRITPQQAMQYARTQDDARRYRELMEQDGRPADAPIVSQEVYGPTQEMVNPGGVSYTVVPTTTDYMPAPPNTEGTNDPNANVIYTPETSPITDNYMPT